jgi:hypothetical protein
MAYLHDVEYAYDNLSMFDQFIDPTYYLDGIADVTMERTEDTELLMTIELDGIAYAEVFDDFTEQFGVYMSGLEAFPWPFNNDWTCKNPLPEEIDYCEPPEFSEVISHLATLGSVTGTVLYDPHDLTWMEIGIDATELINGVVEDEYASRLEDPYYTPHEDNDDWTGVNNLSITFLMENTSTITLPTQVDNVNEIADDFAKFAITKEAYDILTEFAMYYATDPQMLLELLSTDMYLTDIEFMQFSRAFDLEQSYISITGTEVLGVVDPTSLDYEIALYWIDGTLVHDAPVGYADLLPLWLNNELVSQAAYDQMVEAVNDANWHMMKLFAYYMWQDMNGEEEY